MFKKGINLKYFKKAKSKLLLTLFLLALFLVLAGAPFILAQFEGEGLTISPPVKELTLVPGQSTAQAIKLTNPTKNIIEVYPKAMDFKAKNEGGEPEFFISGEEGKNFSLSAWIKLNQTKIALTPEQVVEFSYTINTPEDAEPGGHYGVVFFASEPPEIEKDTSQVAIGSMIGSLVLGRVPGDIKEEGKLETFQAPWFSFKPPVEFITRIANTGNVHFKPKGEIKIKSFFGKEKGSIKVNEEQGNVLPDSIRKFTQKWEPKVTLFSPIGRYTGELKLTYGEDEKTLTGKVVLWIIPLWFIILTIILLVLLIIFVIWHYRKNKEKKSIEDLKKQRPPERPKQRIILR